MLSIIAIIFDLTAKKQVRARFIITKFRLPSQRLLHHEKSLMTPLLKLFYWEFFILMVKKTQCIHSLINAEEKIIKI